MHSLLNGSNLVILYKVIKILTYFLFIVFIVACGVQQKLSISHRLSPGMSKGEVETIMGPPVKSDFKMNIEEWHYCKTGFTSDEFLALFFHEGKLVEKLNYTVTLADLKGASGSCDKFIKLGNYKEPDLIIELRMK